MFVVVVVAAVVVVVVVAVGKRHKQKRGYGLCPRSNPYHLG